MPIGSKGGLWCKAFEKFGKLFHGSHAVGASAVCYILQKRPAFLELQLRRPQPGQLQRQPLPRLLLLLLLLLLVHGR